MKKITLLSALFLLTLFTGKAQGTSCEKFCVLGMSVDTSGENHKFHVILYNGNDTSTYVDYPVVIVTNGSGDTIANKTGLSYMFYQRGGSTITHIVPTDLDSILPAGFTANVYLTDGASDSTCIFHYPSSCITGINELASIPSLDVYPNPAKEEIHIRFGEVDGKQIQINLYDITGSLTRSYATTHTEFIIKREELTTGIYFFVVDIKGTRLTKKLIIE